MTTGSTSGRLKTDGTLIARNSFDKPSIHKVDMRVSKTVKLGSQLKINLLAELFNVFNWENYGNYNTQLDSASFGQPVATSGNAYASRSGQLGLRVEF